MRNHASRSPVLRDCASKVDSFLTSDEMTWSAAVCQSTRRVGCALYHITDATAAAKTITAATAHLIKGERSGRLTLAPARIFSRRLGGTPTAPNFSVMAASNAIDSLNQ